MERNDTNKQTTTLAYLKVSIRKSYDELQQRDRRNIRTDGFRI